VDLNTFLDLTVKAEGDEVKGRSLSKALSELEAAYKISIFVEINRERIKAGYKSLVIDERLSELAAGHNEAMLKNREDRVDVGILISHEDFEKRAQQIFIWSYEVAAENVGAVKGYSNTEVVEHLVTGWKLSESHRQNIEGEFTHTGIAVLIDKEKGTVYATQMFAKA